MAYRYSTFRRLGWAAVLLLLGVATDVAAQSADSTAVLRVRVTDASTGSPIAGARVGFPDLKLFELTNPNGIAQIVRILAGARELEVTMFGYGTASATLMLEPHAVATGDVALRAEAIAIEGITVTSTARIKRLEDFGFYNRAKFAAGYQLGPLEIASKVATLPSDLFRGVPAVQRIPTGFGGKADIVSQRDCGSFRNRNHRLAIYLDGVPYFQQLDGLPLEMIEAAEVYLGVNVPMQFSLDRPGLSGACGVILLWSK